MKVHDMWKKKPKHDAFSTIAPMNCILRFFGLSCLYSDGTKLKYNNPLWKFAFYLIVFFAANAYSVYVKVQSHDEDTKRFTFMDSVELVYLLGYVQYIVDIICIYKYGRQPNIAYFNLYDYIDSILGMPHYKQIRKCIRNMCLVYILVAIGTTVIEVCTWSSNFSWKVIEIYSVELIYLAIRMLAALDVIANYIQVKFRLETIGDTLENYMYHSDNLPGVVKDVINDKVWMSEDNLRDIDLASLKTISNSRHETVIQLSRCYTLLIEQSDYINLKYGFRVLITCCLYLLDMVLLLNLTIRLLVGTLNFLNADRYLLSLSSIGRIVSSTVIVFCGVHRCEQTYREKERIVRLIDHLLISKKITNEIRESLTELKSLILSRPVTYHAVNFFQINYGTLVSITSVIVTYTIILLQNIQ